MAHYIFFKTRCHPTSVLSCRGFLKTKRQTQEVGYGSIRDGYVHATESLDVIMYFKGTLFYKGNPPRVTTEYLSTGQVIPMP